MYIWLQLCQILTDFNNFVPKLEKMYETGRAFTYLLLKESAANDVINVSLFAHNKIMLKPKMLTKEDKTLTKMSGNQQKVRGETIN